MDLTGLLIIIVLALLCIVLSYEIFPRCICCGKTKFRSYFKVHKTVDIKFIFPVNQSICKKCCKKYNISSIEEGKKIKNIKHKVSAEIYGTPPKIHYLNKNDKKNRKNIKKE